MLSLDLPFVFVSCILVALLCVFNPFVGVGPVHSRTSLVRRAPHFSFLLSPTRRAHHALPATSVRRLLCARSYLCVRSFTLVRALMFPYFRPSFDLPFDFRSLFFLAFSNVLSSSRLPSYDRLSCAFCLNMCLGRRRQGTSGAHSLLYGEMCLTWRSPIWRGAPCCFGVWQGIPS